MTSNGISAYVFAWNRLVPAAPSSIVVAFRGRGIDWQDNSTNETSFRIETGDGLEIAAVGANVTHYDPVGYYVAPCEYVSFRVRAGNEVGVSPPAQGGYGCNYIGNPPDNQDVTVPPQGAGESLSRDVAVAASGFDPNTANSIAKVEFFANTIKLGQVLSPPYIYRWNDVTPGTYNVTATATDVGGSTSSAPRVVVDAPPTVNIVTPATGELVGHNLTIVANAFDLDGNGTIAKVEFFANGTKVGEIASAPYIFPWNNTPSGPYSLTAIATDYAGASTTSAPVNVTVGMLNQTITFDPIADKTYGDPSFALSAIASSGLPVSLSLVSGPATISGSSVTLTGVGAVTVRASQSGDGNYNAAPAVDQSFAVLKASQTISFAPLPDKTYGNAAFPVSASGGASGSPVTFSAAGNCTAGGINGSTITLTGAGSCSVTASQAGNSNYNAATDVSRSFTITKANPTVIINGYSGAYDGNPHSATGSATGVNNENLNNLLTLGASFTTVTVGTANWTFAGNANYLSDNGSVSVTITKATPIITWNNPADISPGTALSSTQLNAVATFNGNPLAGSFVYQPGVGAVLETGNAQQLKSWFAPADTTNFQTQLQSQPTVVYINVTPTASTNGFSYRRSITIDHTKVPNTDLSNFPLLISGTYLYLKTTANGGNVENANGYDVIFTSDTGCANKLDHEVETYNASTGAVNYWVKVPTVSHTADTVLYMCYGKASISTSQANPTGVWDSNFVAVYHLPNGSTLNANDSTSNPLNASISNTSAGTGRVDGAGSFNGSSGRVGLPSSTKWNNIATAITLESWVNPNSGSLSDRRDITQRQGGAWYGGLNPGSGSDIWWFNLLSAKPSFYADGITGGAYKQSTSTVSEGSWSHVAVTYNGSTISFYINGALTNSISASGSFSTGDAGGSIGCNGSGFSPLTVFNGLIDELRVSSSARSADWITVEYNNQNSPSTFYAISSNGTNGYAYRRTITIDHTKVSNTDQANFPVAISGTFPYLATTANGGNVQNTSGHDVIFTSDTGCTAKLDHEVESYNPTTGAASYWVKVPTLSHTNDTVLYMCYGNTNISTSQANPTAVWDSNFVAVYHLPNGSTLTANDSTVSPLNASITNTFAGSGRVGGAGDFNGSSSRVGLPASTKWNNISTAITLETWVNPYAGSLSADRRDIIQRQGGAWYGGLNPGSGSDLWWFILITGKPSFYADNITGGLYKITTSPISEGSWSHVVVTYNGSTITFYVNGTVVNMFSATGNFSTGDAGGSIGCNGSGFSPLTPFSGLIDEMRVSSSARSADWIKTEFNNQNSPSTFYAISLSGP